MDTVAPSSSRLASRSSLAAGLSLAASLATLGLLAALHLLSPEFAPSWRMISEYANGAHPGVLSLFFAAWAATCWALAVALWPILSTTRERFGAGLLALSGVGAAMAVPFDINHSLHGLAAMIGMPALPVAALLLTFSLTRRPEWRHRGAWLVPLTHATWIAPLLMAGAVGLFMFTFARAGGDLSTGKPPESLPTGTMAVSGWANRLLVVAYFAWMAGMAATLLGVSRPPRS